MLHSHCDGMLHDVWHIHSAKVHNTLLTNKTKNNNQRNFCKTAKGTSQPSILSFIHNISEPGQFKNCRAESPYWRSTLTYDMTWIANTYYGTECKFSPVTQTMFAVNIRLYLIFLLITLLMEMFQDAYHILGRRPLHRTLEDSYLVLRTS